VLKILERCNTQAPAFPRKQRSNPKPPSLTQTNKTCAEAPAVPDSHRLAMRKMQCSSHASVKHEFARRRTQFVPKPPLRFRQNIQSGYEVVGHPQIRIRPEFQCSPDISRTAATANRLPCRATRM
jgi:hypothetical protein